MTTTGKHTSETQKSKHLSVWALVVIDVLCIAVGLNVFALFHHVLHFGAPEAEKVVLATLPPEPEASAAPEEAEAPVYSGMWGEKFADKFTDGEIIQTENSYQSANVNITFTVHEEPGLKYHVADIYLRDLKYLKSAFARGDFNAGIEPLLQMANDNHAIVGLSGDHYYGRYEGTVVRNGVLYRDTRFADVCVLLSDGTMVTMTDAELDMDNLKESAPYQVWSFGPELLDGEGKAKTSFNSSVLPRNPRSAIGYVEPGHYIFVEVDGRIAESHGMSMEELAQLFEDLGCAAAYNLDGGQSSGITWQGELKSYAYHRDVSDIIYICDEEDEG